MNSKCGTGFEKHIPEDREEVVDMFDEGVDLAVKVLNLLHPLACGNQCQVLGVGLNLRDVFTNLIDNLNDSGTQTCRPFAHFLFGREHLEKLWELRESTKFPRKSTTGQTGQQV